MLENVDVLTKLSNEALGALLHTAETIGDDEMFYRCETEVLIRLWRASEGCAQAPVRRESHLPALVMGMVVGAFGVVFWWAVGSVVVRFFEGLL